MFHPCCLSQLSVISRQNVMNLLKVHYKNLCLRSFNLRELKTDTTDRFGTYTLSRKTTGRCVRQRIQVFQRFQPVKVFPCVKLFSLLFSRAWHKLRVFAHLAPVACFPALGTSCVFSLAWHQLHILPRLVPVTVFPRFRGASCMFSRS